MDNFKLIAIRPHKNCNKEYLKVLEPGRLYQLYNNYQFYTTKDIFDGVNGDITSYKYSKSNDKINFTPVIKEKIGIDPSLKLKIFGDKKNIDSGNIRVFKLKEIYKYHNDTVEEVYLNFDQNNTYFSHSIKEELKSLGSSEAEFYRYHFKNYYNETDFNKRPLSKLTKDIYLKLKEITNNF